ncbi:hypothetical protein LPJ73_005416, partial [Coemansia sp. RSA 2703]
CTTLVKTMPPSRNKTLTTQWKFHRQPLHQESPILVATCTQSRQQDRQQKNLTRALDCRPKQRLLLACAVLQVALFCSALCFCLCAGGGSTEKCGGSAIHTRRRRLRRYSLMIWAAQRCQPSVQTALLLLLRIRLLLRTSSHLRTEPRGMPTLASIPSRPFRRIRCLALMLITAKSN